MACLLVKESPDAEYSLFYDTIQGFEFEPGFEYELKVLKETRENVPADASRFVWTMLEMVNKTAVEPSATFEGTTWKLLAYTNDSSQLSMALPDAEATVVFEGGRMSGNGSCNNFSGTYTLDGESVTIQLGPTTMMACPEPVMAQELAFYTNLAATASYVVVGDQLHLRNANGDVILAFEPLVGTPLVGTLWQATSYNNGQQAVVGVLAGTEITAVFAEDGTLSGSAGCNNYMAGYTIDGDAMTIDQAASTMMMCMDPEGVMEQEAAYLAALSTVATFTIQGDQLELRAADGALVASFVAVPPTPLTGVTWQAVSYNTGTQAVTSVLAGTTITAVFGEDGSLTGSAGCNTYMTSYTTDGHAITIQPAASTRKMCVEPQGVMEQEAAYLVALTTAATYSIQGDQLELRTADGALVASFVPQTVSQIVGVNWEVVNFNNGQALTGPVAGTTITAVFGEDGQMSGNAGCNNYSAGYTVEGSSLTIGPAISTMMMCAEPEGVMEQEMAYLQALQTVASYSLQGDRLDLLTAEGTFVAIYNAQPAAAEAPSAEATAQLQAELGNLAYTGTSVFTGTVQLTNGVYTETVAPESAMVTSIELTDFVAVGELNGQPAAAAILVSTTGGSGVFYDLAVVTQQDGQWTNVATTFLGDRVTINSLAIANNQVIVDMVTQGPNDPMCCATQQVVNAYELQGDKLIQVSSETIGTVGATTTTTRTAESGIVGIVWQWVDTAYSNDTTTTVPNPANYTMALLPDGTVTLQVDCNRGGGTYTLDGSQLTINVATLTRMACPAGSLSEEYVQSLNSAASYVMDGADLIVNMAMDAGNMRFQAAGPAEMPAAAASAPSASEPVTPTVTQPVQAPVDPEAIIGDTWLWASFTDPVNGTQEIDTPERYTLQLLPSGTARIKADCNRGAGKYTVDGSSIDLEVATLTRAACPPGSLDADFVKYLNGAAVWFVQDGDLYLDLFADSGTMRFVK
jgi:heat shock protein HslJ